MSSVSSRSALAKSALAKSALDWLHERRDRSGQSMISAEEFQAGDRLRRDFVRGGMLPRTTAVWGNSAPAGRRRSGLPDTAHFQDGTLAARERVRRALKSVPPEFRDLLMDVCCFDAKLTDLEQRLGWPQRSGKVVLQMALRQLARHYGILNDNTDGDTRATRGILHWASSDYRPELDR